jgi:hypothetical protein
VWRNGEVDVASPAYPTYPQNLLRRDTFPAVPAIGSIQPSPAECSSAWLEHLLWEQGVAGSNPVTPTSIHEQPVVSVAMGRFSLGTNVLRRDRRTHSPGLAAGHFWRIPQKLSHPQCRGACPRVRDDYQVVIFRLREPCCVRPVQRDHRGRFFGCRSSRASQKWQPCWLPAKCCCWFGARSLCFVSHPGRTRQSSVSAIPFPCPKTASRGVGRG